MPGRATPGPRLFHERPALRRRHRNAPAVADSRFRPQPSGALLVLARRPRPRFANARTGMLPGVAVGGEFAPSSARLEASLAISAISARASHRCLAGLFPRQHL